jgi:hypothetical protein
VYLNKKKLEYSQKKNKRLGSVGLDDNRPSPVYFSCTNIGELRKKVIGKPKNYFL